MAFGTPPSARASCPASCAGTEYWAQGYSEPGAGSDLAATSQTRASAPTARAVEWVLHGQKVWTSWAHESDWIFVLARCEPGSQRHQGLVLLLVPLRQPGIEDPADPPDHRQRRVQRGLLRRRAHRRQPAPGRAGAGLEGGDGAAGLRARCVHAGPAGAVPA
jgi:alkylation response protein AidB-like acyl-CoA dehydrogenase